MICAHILDRGDRGVSSAADLLWSRGGFTAPPSLMRLTSQSKPPAPVLPLERQLLLAQQDGDDWKGAAVDA